MRGPRLPAVLLLCAAAALAGPLAATAGAGEPASQAFTSPGEHAFVVPAGLTGIQVTLVGGNGGSGAVGALGGIPATVTAQLAVSPGETLYLEVAGDGQAADTGHYAGGYGGGGEGGERGFSAHGGGGGGGASDIRTCPVACGSPASLASRLLVAGGGGGGGSIGNLPSTTAGGAGGSADQSGFAGQNDAHGDQGGGGGRRGTPSEGGAGGEPASGCEAKTCGAAGVLGSGGIGGPSFIGSGGGGGGGIFGGGGGGGGLFKEVGVFEIANGGGGGGGGGASGLIPGANAVSAFSLVPSATGAEPQITIAWTKPPPTSLTGLPTALTATAATLTGSVNPNGSSVTDCHFVVSPAPPAGANVPCGQQVGGGSVPVAVSAGLGGLAPGATYAATLVAASAQGSTSGSAVAFTTPAAGTAAAAPTVTGLRVSPTRFRRGRGAATISRTRRLPTATTISFTLSAPATVTLTFERAGAGVLVGRRCVAPSRKHAKGRRCTRYTPLSRGVRRPAHAGPTRIRFSGVLDGGARLLPGGYRLSLSAAGAGGTTTAPQRPTLTIVGP